MAVMTDRQFVDLAKDIALNYKTLYVLGCFGSPMTPSNKQRYINAYPYNRNRASIINSASSDTFGFDCVCLIKGILWGWNGNVNATYGGAVYGSNGVPDVGADGMMNYCTEKSTNFSNIVPGEVVHMSGHIGIYIGDGLAVECTPAWKNKVQITVVGNIGTKAGYPTRTWNNHGKLQFIDYNTTPAPEPIPEPTWNIKIGDKVIINGDLYTNSNADTPAGHVTNKETYITRIATGTKHPYNTTGDLGWMDRDSITVINETPKTLTIGTKVRTIATGKASSDGSGVDAMKGLTGVISRIIEGAKYPYLVSDNEGALGWYQASALEII